MKVFNDQERVTFQGAGYRRAGQLQIHWRVEERVIALEHFPVWVHVA